MAFDLSRPPSAKGGSLAAQYGQMMNRRQPGGISSISPGSRAVSYTDPVMKAKAKFFDNRKDVTYDRAQRRLQQENYNLLDRLTMFKPVEGTGGTLLQSTVPGGPTIAEAQAARARQFGPTFKEIMSDINYGAGQIAQGLAEKGSPLINLAKSVGSGVQNFVTNTLPSMVPEPLMQNIDKGLGAFNNFMQSGQNFNMLLMALPPRERRIYDREIMKPGMTRENAYRIAKGIRQMSMGGVASL